MKRIGRTKGDKSGWYILEPADATHLVENQIKNRPLVEGRANRIAKDILEGKWTANGESVVLTHHGKLLDGQHRCRGVIIADKAILTYVVWLPQDRPEEAVFDTINIGKSRTAADRLIIDGVDHGTIAAAIVRQTLLWERYGRIDASNRQGYGAKDKTGTGQPRDTVVVSTGDIRKFYREHKTRLDAATAAVALYQNLLRGWARPSSVGFVYAQASKLDQKKADEFIHGLATGEGLSGNSPILKLRKRLQQEVISRAALPARHSLALIIKSWNAFYNGDDGGRLAFHESEGFPTFDGSGGSRRGRKRGTSSGAAAQASA